SALTRRAAAVPSVAFRNEEEFRKYIDSRNNHERVVGIWETEDKNYRLGITSTDKSDQLQAFLLEARDASWTAGKVKIQLRKTGQERFESTYYYADFNSEKKFTRLIKNY